MELTIDNHTVLIDDEDCELVSRYKWRLIHKGNKSYYAITHIRTYGARSTVLMHRLLLDLQKREYCDHINGNGLDNRKSNLRKCTQAQNTRNSSIPKNNTSGYKGVHCYPRNHINPWKSSIRIDYKQIHIGYFSTKEEAALAYNKKAIELFGEFARPNIIR